MEGLEEDKWNCTQGKKLRQGRQFREDATLHEAIKPTTTQKRDIFQSGNEQQRKLHTSSGAENRVKEQPDTAA